MYCIEVTGRAFSLCVACDDECELARSIYSCCVPTRPLGVDRVVQLCVLAGVSRVSEPVSSMNVYVRLCVCSLREVVVCGLRQSVSGDASSRGTRSGPLGTARDRSGPLGIARDRSGPPGPPGDDSLID